MTRASVAAAQVGAVPARAVPASAAPARAVPDLRGLEARTRPLVLAGEQVLPVLPAIAQLLPWQGLQRGTTVAVAGSAALALALAAGPSSAGSWIAAAGLPRLGLLAAAEAGIDLDRLALVHAPEGTALQARSGEPGSAGRGQDPCARRGQDQGARRGAPDSVRRFLGVVAALLDAIDIVLVGPPARLRVVDADRLAARARDRGSVLLPLETAAGVRPGAMPGVWPGRVDVRLTLAASAWHGLGDGYGHLETRLVEVAATGRGAAARPRTARLWLPGLDGAVAPHGLAPDAATPDGAAVPEDAWGILRPAPLEAAG